MKAPIRTLLFSSLFPSSARPTHGIFVETRLRELLKSGRVQTHVVAPVPWFPSTDERWGNYARFARTPQRERRHGLDVQHPRYLLPPKVGMTLAPLLMAAGALPALRRLRTEGFDFDLIDAHYYYPDGIAAVLLGRVFGCPVVVTARGSDINLIPQYRWPRRWLTWAAGQATASIGVSGALVARMQSLAFDPARLHVMRNGVDLERFHPMDRAQARHSLGLTGAPILLSVGNLHEYKGQRVAVEALALLRRQSMTAELVLVGEGPDAAELQSLAQSLGVANAVHWVGVVPHADLAQWYSAADVLVLASSREGWPNVLLESMACGTPVVASDVGGVREVVRSSAAGRLVVHRTAAEFARALLELLAAPPHREAVRAYASQFDWGRTSRDQVSLFESLVETA